MASDSAFQMNYGHVDGKARCAVIRGTILKSRLMGDLFIGCTEHGALEKAFKKLAPKGVAFDNSIAQDMVVFRSDTVALGDQARAAVPPSSWEKMDTAPKDGREVILLVSKRAGIPHRTLVGHWMGGGHCIEDHPPISAGWYFWNGNSFDKASEPLLWMPLPDLPVNFKE